MKKMSTLLLVMLLPFLSFSQKNFQHFAAGAGFGASQMGGDLSKSDWKRMFTAGADYFFSPYIQSGLEVQLGKTGTSSADIRYSESSLKSLIWINKVHWGQFMMQRGFPVGSRAFISNTIKGIYMGTGLGVVHSRQGIIYRNSPDQGTFVANKTTDVVIPLTFGIDNSGFDSKIVAGIAYQAHFALADQVDRYSTNAGKQDYYGSMVLSLKFRFGGLGIY